MHFVLLFLLILYNKPKYNSGELTDKYRPIHYRPFLSHPESCRMLCYMRIRIGSTVIL